MYGAGVQLVGELHELFHFAHGLLGGMVETPTSPWEPDYEPSRAMLDAPIEARWQRLPGTVRHVFTHFPLELTIFLAKVPKGPPEPADMRWTLRRDLHEEALPGVMKKVLAHALGTGKPEKKEGVKVKGEPD